MSRPGRKLPKPAGYHWLEKDPHIHPENGKPSCRWCKGRVDSPLRSFCSEECVFNWTRRTRWRITRAALFEMRKGKCEKCGLDLRLIDESFCRKQMEYSRRIESGAAPSQWRKYKPPVYVDSCGRPFSHVYWREKFNEAIAWAERNKCVGRDVWDADHIQPLSLGGDPFLFSNLAALCVPCHRRKTCEDGSRMAGRKKKKDGAS
jgi:hypothetical protein